MERAAIFFVLAVGLLGFIVIAAKAAREKKAGKKTFLRISWTVFIKQMTALLESSDLPLRTDWKDKACAFVAAIITVTYAARHGLSPVDQSQDLEDLFWAMMEGNGPDGTADDQKSRKMAEWFDAPQKLLQEDFLRIEELLDQGLSNQQIAEGKTWERSWKCFLALMVDPETDGPMTAAQRNELEGNLEAAYLDFMNGSMDYWTKFGKGAKK